MEPVPGGATASGRGAAPDLLRAFAETRRFSLGYPTRVRVTPDGSAVLFLRSPADRAQLGLFEFDVATGETRELVTPEQLLGGAGEAITPEEQARRERMRITLGGFSSFDLSHDGSLVLLPLSGRVYLLDRGGPARGRVRSFADEAGAMLDPRLSPDGTRLAYVVDHDVHVVEIESGRRRAVTRGGTEQVTHGLAEFVAQEEMHRFEGYWWSPDGTRIAFEAADHTGLERFTIADPAHPERPALTFPYPRPGRANARVRLGIVPLAQTDAEPGWIEWDAGRYPYLARVLWSSPAAPLTILVQTRDQREQALLAVDADTGRTTPLLVERDEAFLDLDPELPRWLPDGSGFLWTTDRSGDPQLELRDRDGTLVRTLLPDRRDFFLLQGVTGDSRTAFALTATPTTTQLWRVPLDGSPATPMTDDTQERRATFARDGSVWVETATTAASAPASVVRRADGSAVGTLPAAARPLPALPNLELTTVTGASGHSYHAAIVRPRDFAPGQRYPVIVSVYGGPTALTVAEDARRYLLAQWFADHGAVVVSIDNRGTPRRGRDWRVAVDGSFGTVPLDDQVDALRALGARHLELDLARVGIYGWSFGGYMSALAVLRRPDVFKAGAAGAPVVDWHDYDTHYTERYLDLPEANPAGYAESSLLTYAADLQRPLLLAHGTADDNVYFFHSLKLADVLFKAGKAFEFVPLAGLTHQVPDPVVTVHLYERIIAFLLGALG